MLFARRNAKPQSIDQGLLCAQVRLGVHQVRLGARQSPAVGIAVGDRGEPAVRTDACAGVERIGRVGPIGAAATLTRVVTAVSRTTIATRQGHAIQIV